MTVGAGMTKGWIGDSFKMRLPCVQPQLGRHRQCGLAICTFHLGFSPNPPNGVGRARERDLTGMETGASGGFRVDGSSSRPVASERSRSCSGRRRQGTLAGRFVRREWERYSTEWWMRERVVDRLPALRSGGERQGAQSGQGASELGFPRPAPRQVQCQAAGRAGEPSGQGEEAPPQGLGGHHLLTQTDPGCPARQVVRHRLHRQPSGVGGETAGR